MTAGGEEGVDNQAALPGMFQPVLNHVPAQGPVFLPGLGHRNRAPQSLTACSSSGGPRSLPLSRTNDRCACSRTRASVSKRIDRWFGSMAKTWALPTMSRRLETGGRDSGDPSLEERRDLEPVHGSARAETYPAAQLDYRHLLRHRRSSIGRGCFVEGARARLEGLDGDGLSDDEAAE